MPALIEIISLLANPTTTAALPNFAVIVQFFGGFATFWIYLWLLGLNIFIFTRRDINFVFMMEIAPRGRLLYLHYFEVGNDYDVFCRACFTIVPCHSLRVS